jgi:hypothetical protein
MIALGMAGTGFREQVTWPEPSIGPGATTIDVPVEGGDFSGNSTNADCVVRMPAQPVTGEVKVAGCRNLSLVGGEFRNDGDPCGAAAGYDHESVALYLTDFSGTAHVEGLKIHGHGFSDGIWMVSTQPNSVGEVEASRVGGLAACEEPLTGSVEGWPKEHPDCFQTWAGPSVLRFDKFTCYTIYEGLNVDTDNWANSSGLRFPARLIEVRRTNVHLDERIPNGRQCFMAWHLFSPAPTVVERAYCTVGNAHFQPVNPSVPSDPSWWSAVTFGLPPGGDETTDTEAGIGYVPYVPPIPGEPTDPIIPPLPTLPTLPPSDHATPPVDGVPGPSAPGGGRVSRIRVVAEHGGAFTGGVRRPLVIRLSCAGRCRVRVTATISSRDARRLGLRSGGHRVAVGSAVRRVRAKARLRIVLHLTHRRRLERAHRLSVRVEVERRTPSGRSAGALTVVLTRHAR